VKTTFIALIVLALVGCAGSKQAQTEAPKPKDGIKPYSQVITKEAVSDSGVFVAHKVKQKWYYEIPMRELGREFLFVTTQEKTQTGLGYGGDGINSQVVRWERNEDRILLRSVLFASVAADSLPVSYSVRKANFPPIIMAFDIQAYNRDSSALVIEVTDLFSTDVAELGMNRRARDSYKVRRLDPKRSFVESIRSFPENIETRSTMTYEATQVPADNSLGTITVLFHHSMVRLPDKPMMPRLYDERVSFFGVRQYDYGYDAQRAEERRYIARWRLEPKDISQLAKGELTEPVKPIVFYIDRGVPDKWRPWLKKGVESWQVAFEKAGFKNAILAKDPPSEKEDPDWSSEDARYATIRWLPSEIQNAYGPHISDPRTGEILDADIGFFHNVMNLARNWYFVQVGPVDPRASTLPLPDEVMGELLQYIAAHEVGHSLGFPHNMKATSQYPVDSLRSRTFTEIFGTEASIMDYGRFNYVAQPGDGARLIPIIGPYDKFATEWGYRPIPGASTPDDEKGALNRIAARQEREPYLRFGNADGIDPTAQTEDLGDDAVAATRYGMMNLKRVASMLLSATTKDGEDYAMLKEVYDQMIAQRNRELGHVANVIGGVVRTNRVAGQEGPIHVPVSRQKQREAMQFLHSEGFRTPTEILLPDILNLVEPTGTQERIKRSHQMLLSILLNNGRLERMVNTQGLAQKGESPYTLGEMLAELRNGIWSELNSPRITIDLYRRNLQRTYLETVGAKLNPEPPSSAQPSSRFAPPSLPGEARALLRYELEQLDMTLARAIAGAANVETRAHLKDSRATIKNILDSDEEH
jgi:hypothetical protein